MKELDYDELVIGYSADGQKQILADWITLTLQKEQLGQGAYCKVLKAIGQYTEVDVQVPYAVKVYNKQKLQHLV